jgi:hypothetical protein
MDDVKNQVAGLLKAHPISLPEIEHPDVKPRTYWLWALILFALIFLGMMVFKALQPTPSIPEKASPSGDTSKTIIPITPLDSPALPTQNKPNIQQPMAGGNRDFDKKTEAGKALAMAYYEKTDGPEVSTIRGRDTKLMQAQKDFAEGKYTAVVAALNPLPEDKPATHFVALKLRGHSYFRLKNYDQAAIDFGKLAESPADRELSEWLILLSHAARGKDGRNDFLKAISIIQADTSHPYYQEAIALKDSFK